MFTRMKQRLFSKKGFISIELMLVAGVIVILTVVAMTSFSKEAATVNTTIHQAIENAQNNYTP